MSGRLSADERVASGLAAPARYTGILDGNHGDVGHIKDLAAMVASGIGAWIAKATEGYTYDDPAFATFVPRARGAGLLVGAYHFARGEHGGLMEADHFLRITRPARAVAPMLLAYDWESEDASPDDARAFVTRVHEVTGRWPVVYAGVPFLGRATKLGPRAVDAVLGQCPLWYAAYGVDPAKPKIHPTWPQGYAMMQYTNGGAGPTDLARYPRKTTGIGGCDRSCYQGDEAACRAWWAAQAVGLGPTEHCL